MKKLPFPLVLVCAALAARAENWPQWRGPAFNGSSPETALPASFDKAKDAVWVTPLPGPSAGTPIVWEDRVFVSSTDAKTQDLLALCISRKDGKVLWKKVIAIGVPRASPTGKNTWASPSPCTDGKLVFFTYGSGDLAAFDMDGKEIWTRNLVKDFGNFTYMHGYSASPLLWRGKLYVPVLRRDRVVEKGAKGKPAPAASPGELLDSFIVAIDAASGKDVWKSVRKGDGKEGALECYASPVPYETPERRELVLSGSDSITGHNPDSGAELWRWGAMQNPETSRTVVTALIDYKDNLIFGAGAQKQPVYAIKAGASGAVSDAQVAWKKPEAANVCTPAFCDGSLFLLDHFRKTFTRLDAKTGEKKWQAGLGAGKAPEGTVNVVNILTSFSASPTVADGKVYCVSEGGDVLIFSATGDEPKLLCHAPLEETYCYSSISVAHGQLFLRTGQNLYCIGKK